MLAKKNAYFQEHLQVGGFLTNELRVASYVLRVTIYCPSYELPFTYESLVVTYCTSFLHTSYELLLMARVTSYFLYTSYDLLFIARVTI